MHKLYSINDTLLSRRDIYMLQRVLMSRDGMYSLNAPDTSWPRFSLDMLVLEGFIERERSMDGRWLDEWTITEAGLHWTDSATDTFVHFGLTPS